MLCLSYPYEGESLKLTHSDLSLLVPGQVLHDGAGHVPSAQHQHPLHAALLHDLRSLPEPQQTHTLRIPTAEPRGRE